MAYRTYSPDGVSPPPPQTWSNIKMHANGHFQVAGLVSPGDTMYDQAKGIFASIRLLVEAAGGTMDDIQTMQIFLTNLDENTEVWRARREFFTGDYPCSTLIEVSRVGSPQAQPPAKIEINCSGWIGGSR